MVITGIERARRQRGRFDVYVDGEPRLQLGRELLKLRGLRPGGVIEPQEIAALAEADARARAMQAAAAMLARRPHSEREVRMRLLRGRFGQTVTEETIEKLRAARLLDDAEFARGWVHARDEGSPRGRRLLTQELRARGVSRELAAQAAGAVSDEDAAYRAAERRSGRLAALDYPTYRARLAGYLQRRGFGWDEIQSAIDRGWRAHSEAPIGRDRGGQVE